MKIAYLLLCHKAAEQVSMLINTLKTSNTDFYIHVDKKAENFNIAESDNIFIVPKDERIDIQWGGRSMTDATLKLIHYMLDTSKKYDYVILLSGQDFPIKTNEEIITYLSNNYGYNFIELLEHDSKKYKRYTKRNEIIYPLWMFKRTTLLKIIKKLYIYVTGGHYQTFSCFKRKNTMHLQFEFGSQWWCLTYDCVKWISDYIKYHNEINDFFKNALVPDEGLFQTVFAISPYKNTQRDKLTYLEMFGFKNHPRTLTIDDYEMLKKQDKLFARKFELEIDKQIIHKLQSEQ